MEILATVCGAAGYKNCFDINILQNGILCKFVADKFGENNF
jgi:hypothetical protein